MIVLTKYLFPLYFSFIQPFFYFIYFQKWFIIFPFYIFDWFTCCFDNAKSREKKERSHVNIYIQKQHICNVVCYTVELHCLYKNRSPDDPRLILMSPCFFLKLFMWLIRLKDLQFKSTFSKKKFLVFEMLPKPEVHFL